MPLTRHRVKSFRRRMEKRGVKFGIDSVPKLSESIRQRDWVHYQYMFGFKEIDLIGKAILDVGAGRGLFVEQARQRGVNAFGLEPIIGRENKFIQKGTIQKFKSRKKFDFVVANLSVPKYLSSAFNVRLSVYNMVRALKPNGKVLIFPIDVEKSGIIDVSNLLHLTLNINTLKQKLAQCGFICSFKKSPHHHVFQIERTPNADLDKLRRWLSLD